MADDNTGNTLGPRATYTYTDDQDGTWNILLDEGNSDAIGNPKATVAALAISATGSLPFSVRRVRLRDKDDNGLSKSVVVCSRTNPLYAGVGSQEVTINGVIFVTTGTIPEQRTFYRLTDAEPPV